MIKQILITAVTTAIITGCISEQLKTLDSLEKHVSKTSEALSSGEINIEYIERLNRKHNGYYYIVDKGARIVYHPETGLIGSDFSRFGFIRKIIKEKNGCIRSDAGGVSRLIIYRDKGADEILCYTIADYEVTASERCTTYIDEEAE